MLKHSRIELEWLNGFNTDKAALEVFGSRIKDHVVFRDDDGRHDERNRIIWALGQEPPHTVKP